MDLNTTIWLNIVTVILLADAMIAAAMIINKVYKKGRMQTFGKNREYILRAVSENHAEGSRKIPFSFYAEMRQSLRLDAESCEKMKGLFDIKKAERKALRRAESVFRTTRIRGVAELGMLGTEKARHALELGLLREKDSSVKLYMANSLSEIGDSNSISVMVASLFNANRFYREKVNMLIAGFGSEFNDYLPTIMTVDRVEIVELIVDFASGHFSALVKDYLIQLIDTRQEKLDWYSRMYGSDVDCCGNCIHRSLMVGSSSTIKCRYKGIRPGNYVCRRHTLLPVSINSGENYRQVVYKACRILAEYYPAFLDDEKYLKSADQTIKNIAVGALANYRSEDRIVRLIGLLTEEETSRSASKAISAIIEKNPGYINAVADALAETENIVARRELARILAGKIEYFIMKLTKGNKEKAEKIIFEVLKLGRSSEIIDFLNKNKNLDIEAELIRIVRKASEDLPELEHTLSIYLNRVLLEKCGIIPYMVETEKKEEKKDRNLTTYLVELLVVMTAGPFLIYAVRHMDTLRTLPLDDQIRHFVRDFNYGFVFYSAAINIAYLMLLLFSYINVVKQKRLQAVKDVSMLFKKKMLPSVSIIAPAYNEEKTIIESSNSLLNLKYPDYELIIVNDGSKDDTLQTLIRYFNLIRVDYMFESSLKTKPVRGIYRNPARPGFTVVDKENGGKADTLNAGINISSKEYFCGIDADSLIEEEALLRLAAMTLDENQETPALGGNIFPINGCQVEKGKINKTGIPRNCLARVQMMEYIRSFMGGRLGWAYLNSLLIISGAFGLFRKDRVVGVGGYLTSSERYEKDTVGEDMELVVRIVRSIRELGGSYRICYAYNANCWTEVPEEIGVLRKQRYRWHKGLIDILYFHKEMLFNPDYGRAGIMAMPYFFIFEMAGPLIEMGGYFMAIAAFFLGMMNYEIALLLFVTTILMGTLVSMSSLMISEKGAAYFTVKEVLVLAGYAIAENFGIRQILSVWRVGAFFEMFRSTGGWNKAERKGFSSAQTADR
ncbi:glycosyltransferase family 2 protein [Anaerobium acetethylicum]|uniref:Glycosyltransferase, catalytic subunit of cellulose synthase and poly-beta-1,6-N-acetylglucosamine synthase n=1 Tax=Anaerobium acetethylicum TaxID=1619234 RepID=A0A1D3TT10_9FIRM|nr:glycosyltransferase [Anaerobium acetethylicum]SCP97083.1 Glycosyltransferase, catalytic subunit of cellulose synthase and poly-beta-1,6-N-acetylglucosamine synthase [Anaerobium acetethylicum]